jgi:hypothetical protein
MRVVGNPEWTQCAASPQEAMERGGRRDAATHIPGVPDFQPRGLFRGSLAYFIAMDGEKARRRQAWFQEHTKRPV